MAVLLILGIVARPLLTRGILHYEITKAFWDFIDSWFGRLGKDPLWHRRDEARGQERLTFCS